jgi:mannose-6-phosphate isomerase
VASLAHPHSIEHPWGREVRFAQTDRYAGALLHLAAGRRISHRYHARRDETAYLLSGRVLLTQGEGFDSLDTWELGPGSSWRNEPGVVHAIEALEDAVVLQVSTPEHEDAVRLEDLYGRVVTD